MKEQQKRMERDPILNVILDTHVHVSALPHKITTGAQKSYDRHEEIKFTREIKSSVLQEKKLQGKAAHCI